MFFQRHTSMKKYFLVFSTSYSKINKYKNWLQIESDLQIPQLNITDHHYNTIYHSVINSWDNKLYILIKNPLTTKYKTQHYNHICTRDGHIETWKIWINRIYKNLVHWNPNFIDNSTKLYQSFLYFNKLNSITLQWNKTNLFYNNLKTIISQMKKRIH